MRFVFDTDRIAYAIRMFFSHLKGTPRCRVCRAKLPAKHFMVLGQCNGKPMLIDNTTGTCPRCTLTLVHHHFTTAKLAEGRCDYTGEVRPVVRAIVNGHLNLHFAREHWNCFQASEEAFEEVLMRNGKIIPTALHLLRNPNTSFSPIQNVSKYFT